MFAADGFDEAEFEVFEACHATDTLMLLEARTDVPMLITDVEMDGGSMNGFELFLKVRERWPCMGLVIVSGGAAPTPSGLPEGGCSP